MNLTATYVHVKTVDGRISVRSGLKKRLPLCMDYFKNLLDLLKAEREEDRNQYRKLTETTSISERRANGLTWYPIAIRGSEMSRGDYVTVEVERTTHQDISHQLRSGMPALFF